MSRLSLLLVAFSCILCVVSAVTVTPFNDGTCSQASAVGAVTGTPQGSCQPLALYGRSIKVSCAGGQTSYQEWSNLNCVSSPSFSGSIGTLDMNACIPLTAYGSSSPSAGVKIDCSGAAVTVVSSFLLMLLAFVAINMQKM